MAIKTLVGVDPDFLVALTDKIKEQGHGATLPVLHTYQCRANGYGVILKDTFCYQNPFTRHSLPGYIKYLGKEVETLLSQHLPCIKIINIHDRVNGLKKSKQRVVFHLDDLYYIFLAAGVEERLDRYCAELPYSSAYRLANIYKEQEI